jgi:hypothetical protein
VARARNTITISARDARSLALTALGFGGDRSPPRPPSAAALRRMVRRTHVLQVDAVNVLVRAHFVPLFSRLGPYPVPLLDDLTYRKGELFEYFAHAAARVRMDFQPLLRWRMARHEADPRWVAGMARIERERPGYIAAVLQEITNRGPLAFSDLTDQARVEKVATKYAESSIAWWHWSDGKHVLNHLFASGTTAIAGRRGFEPLFDLADRVIPAAMLARPTPAPADAARELVAAAAAAHGVATTKDLADYFRLSIAQTRAAIRDLVEAGDLAPAAVEGWPADAFVHRRALNAASAIPPHFGALVSPFDPLVWERARTERLFGFRYRIEIYVPEPKREYGYYVLPFLLGDSLVGRCDLKADRKRSTLLVPGAFLEPGADRRVVVPALGDELRRLASWLGLDHVEIGVRGDLAAPLAKLRLG